MKLPNKEEFNFKDCVIAGDECWLITPKDMSVKWNDENTRFRSCVVRKSDNFVISQGFRKFTNFGEQPAFEPWKDCWKFEARHKLDGSLLIVSRYKGQWIIRTRGTVDARQLPNGHEIDLLIEKYKNLEPGQYEKKIQEIKEFYSKSEEITNEIAVKIDLPMPLATKYVDEIIFRKLVKNI